MERRAFYRELIRRLESEGRVDVTTWLSGKHQGEKWFGFHGEEAETFRETLRGKIPVIVLGGGHVSLALENILKLLEFHLTVIDDREEFANRERFSLADEVFRMDFETEFPQAVFTEGAYYIIVTRGHQYDYICLKEILKRTSGYIGMIGSRKKVAAAFQRLREEGVSEEEIRRVHAPIGLPIGGSTPAEIAVSIAAEIIQVKETSGVQGLEEEVKETLLKEEGPLVMVTVLKKEGSSPRGRGSRMLVGEYGKIKGSIGGGAVEYEAARYAKESLGHELFETVQYRLSDGQAADLGMICGGSIQVLFESL